jgi:hypothetical protein
MSSPREPDDVKLISSIFSPQDQLIETAMARLEGMFGPTDWRSPQLLFDRTRYYEKEMGWPLHRRFISFRDLIGPEALVEVKLKTNDLEQEFARGGKRILNIDPGYICMERLVLATGKNYTHRIHLAKGIYADLTLVFHKGGFRPLAWTYRDYAQEDLIGCFNEIRARYKEQLADRGERGGEREEGKGVKRP